MIQPDGISHGRGITMPILRDELKVTINDFGTNQEFNDAIRGYHKLLKNYMMVRRFEVIVHTKNQFMGV